MSQTKIEWADAVWNPVTGCKKISPACDHCYAERMARRLQGRCGYPATYPFRVTWHEDRLDEPLHWRKPRRIFLGSMTDLCHPDVRPEWIDRILEVIAYTPRHTYLMLTKRPERLEKAFYVATPDNPCRELGSGDFLTNLWVGTSIWDQPSADRNIPWLLQFLAAVRFVSIEPYLRPLDLTPWLKANQDRLDWVILGGETGPGARPMDPDWARSARDQCQAAGVPFFYKGSGTFNHPGLRFRGMKKSHPSYRLLDGRTWNEFPKGKP